MIGLVCVLLYTVIVMSMFFEREANGQQQAENVFDNFEKQIQNYDQVIEQYMQSIYTNKTILEDFMYFLGNEAQQYYTFRLLNEDATQFDLSFINECKKFAAQQKGIIRQMNFVEGDSVNSISFQASGNATTSFCIPEADLINKQKLPEYYYTYEKNLPNPSDYSKQMGRVQIVLDVAPLFKSIENSDFKYAYAITGESILPILDKDEIIKNRVAGMSAADLKRTGSVLISSSNTLYYTTCRSQNLDFFILMATDTAAILQDEMASYVFLLFGFLLFYALISIFIALRMNVDALYLERILECIDGFKDGNFTQEKIKQRNDEYSLIANALNEMSDRIKQYIEQEYLLKLKQQKAEMAALENQINPHFLYNTLEIIRSRAYRNGDEVVANAIYNLGSTYRNMVKSEPVITIEKEVEMLTQYLKLMEFKYDENFYYQIDIQKAIKEMRTIKFWMQPLVENFFSHGFKKDNPFNLILILGEETETAYIIRVVDNGAEIEKEKLAALNKRFTIDDSLDTSEHIGLRNVYLRLRYFYGSGMRMQIKNNEEAGITIQITIDKE